MVATLKSFLTNVAHNVDSKGSNSKFLISVEELIDKAMGPPDQNVIHFKLLQKILHILSHHLRILNKKVYIGPDYVLKTESKSKSEFSDEGGKAEGTTKEKPKRPKAAKGKRRKSEEVVNDLTSESDIVGSMSFSSTELADFDMIDDKTAKPQKTDQKLLVHVKKPETIEHVPVTDSVDKVVAKKDRSVTAVQEKSEKAVESKKEIVSITQETETKDLTAAAKEKTKTDIAKNIEKKVSLPHASVSDEKWELKLKESVLPSTTAPSKQKTESLARSSILIREEDFQNERIIVVEKGPSTYSSGSRPRVSSIQVVTQSQFELLEEAVNDLKEKVDNIQMPKLPDDKQLKDDILLGKVSALEVIGTMQVAARVQAAEEAITSVARVLAEMAQKGIVPTDVAQRLGDVNTEMSISFDQFMAKSTAALQKSRIIEALKPSLTSKSVAATSTYSQRPYSAASAYSSLTASMKGAASLAEGRFVTTPDMENAIKALKAVLLKFIASESRYSTIACEKASEMAKTVEAQMSIIIQLNLHINKLQCLVRDYNQEFKGFGSGFDLQMKYFHEQIEKLRVDLKLGLNQMEMASSHTTEILMAELKERYEEAVQMLDRMMMAQNETYIYNNELREDLRGLAEYVELLSEQKMDREELIDCLKDKVHASRMRGLITEERFNRELMAMIRSIDKCYDKFDRQEDVWLTAIRDLAQTLQEKADVRALTRIKEFTEKQMQDVQKLVNKLATKLGEPETAILTRKVSMNGVCAPCRTPAKQQAEDANHHAPAKLPAARPSPVGEEQPCSPPVAAKGFLPKLMQEDSPKAHLCKRWVGGSHTLINDTRLARAPRSLYPIPPVRRYLEYGPDGKAYKVEEPLQPCVECHVSRPDTSQLLKPDAKPNVSKDKLTIYKEDRSMDKEGKVLSMEAVVPQLEHSYDIVSEDMRTDELVRQSAMAVRSIVFYDEEGALEVEGKIE